MKQRLAIISITLMLVLAVVANKIIGERTLEHLGKTSSEIYGDRLLVESYIYQLSDLFYKKKITFLSSEIPGHSKIDKKEIQRQTAEIAGIIHNYSLTKFTKSELAVFEKLKNNVRHLSLAEEKSFLQQDSNMRELIKYCELSSGYLDVLSAIQVSEGRSLNEDSKKTLSFSQLAAQMEWAVYIIILVLLLYALRKRKIFGMILPKYELN